MVQEHYVYFEMDSFKNWRYIKRSVRLLYLPSKDTAVCLIRDLHCSLYSLKMSKCLHAGTVELVVHKYTTPVQVEDKNNWVFAAKITEQLGLEGWTALPTNRLHLHSCLFAAVVIIWLLRTFTLLTKKNLITNIFASLNHMKFNLHNLIFHKISISPQQFFLYVTLSDCRGTHVS